MRGWNADDSCGNRYERLNICAFVKQGKRRNGLTSAKVILGEIVPVYSDKILSEYQEVLQRQKFKFPAEDQIYLLSAIKKYGKHINPVPSDVVLPDKKDLPFYEAAVTNEGQYLVTGNKKHFPNASFILTPREMLSIMDEP